MMARAFVLGGALLMAGQAALDQGWDSARELFRLVETNHASLQAPVSSLAARALFRSFDEVDRLARAEDALNDVADRLEQAKPETQDRLEPVLQELALEIRAARAAVEASQPASTDSAPTGESLSRIERDLARIDSILN